MHARPHPFGPARPFLALALGVACASLASTPTAALGDGWASARRVFSAPVVPSHDMTTDANGAVHIASDRGASGVWYITNASGSWTECQVSAGDDRRPSIATEGGVVHIAFSRSTPGEAGIYTASSDQPAAVGGCGWAVTARYAGSASHPAVQARGGTLMLAFRTGDRKLRFAMGPAGAPGWPAAEVIDGSCCTSPVALALTDGGAPRVAFGDGASRAQGLKFGVRTPSRWRTTKAYGGRVTEVALVLDQMPGLFGEPPSNAPHIAFVAVRKGAFHTTKGNDAPRGSWDTRFIARAFGSVDLTHASNVTYMVYGRKGSLESTRASGGIWLGARITGTGRDGQPRLAGGQLTFTRKGSPPGIYSTSRP